MITAVAKSVVADLGARMRGPLLTPESPGYDEARSIWNAMIDRRPALIARCLGTADVVTGVAAAAELDLPLCIKGGGHNIAGLAVCDGGLMLDLSLMRGVWVDPAARRARAQPGCLLGDVDRETQLHGLAAVLGFVSNTGIGGLTLGGGFGYLTPRYGWTADNVASIDVVTAAGGLVRASERENADLFWGLRGGGGNFGVATSFEYELHPVGPEIFAGAIAWPIERAGEVFALYRSIMESAPPELVCVIALRLAPAAPWLTADIHGKPVIAIFYCHTGSVHEGEALAVPFRQLGSSVGDIIQRRTYVSQQSLFDATQPKGRRYYWKSEYLRAAEASMLDAALEHAHHLRSPHSAILVFPLGGAINNSAETHTAAGNRDARYVINIAASWEDAHNDAANIEWARTAWQDLRRFSTGGTYVNFLTEDDGEDRVRAAYGANHERLVALKTKWDPANLFRANKNIVPGAPVEVAAS